MSASYVEICEQGKAEAEQRLIDHFKDNGGEVWTIRSGCMGCKAVKESLKTCSQCKTALFCSKDCQTRAWKTHKHECSIIATLSEKTIDETAVKTTIQTALETLSWSQEDKTTTDAALIKVAASIGLSGSTFPGWFCTINFVEHPARQSIHVKAIVQLYALLRDEQCWVRDTDSFPRSSYTFASTIPKTSAVRKEAIDAFLKLQGPLVVFSAWLQDPQPPAIQTIPFEKRLIHGLLDSLLQIE
ncbi:hypothetical protein LEN26_010138 [Aphanomyces euteiches]|nr:hypothetical protein LEN26_010138 [Aphanomyces euteiches]KAH9129805.1 hypothetical protein AeMF1_000153 [Aphanomyces euteiches]KAH9196420.1 hypothetical protein AeNC1_001606 [Aphanomyces euteiches]